MTLYYVHSLKFIAKKAVEVSEMNIKEVEKLTGISSQNIRFYEKSGLIQPARNQKNGYRDYKEDDIRKLKLIKMFRMIDMPLEQIKLILCGEKELVCSLEEQQKLLEEKLADTKYAIEVCDNLRKTQSSINDIAVDEYLYSMEKERKHFFDKWISDYKDVVNYEHQRTFTFTPDNEVTDRYGFANALYAYAMENNIELVITKEGMYPEFTIDGVEYTAERNYTSVKGIPVAVIRCTRKAIPEVDSEYYHGRKKWLRIVHICWPVTVLGIFLMISGAADSMKGFLMTAEGWITMAAILIVCVAMIIRNYYLYWNRDYKYEDKHGCTGNK